MITIYGAFDDLIEIEGCDGADEYPTYGKGPVAWRADLIAPGGQEAMRVYAIYEECWSFAISQTMEDIPLPAWPVKISQHDSGYSTLVEIDAPAGTRLTNTRPEALSREAAKDAE
jgi:hypothetical protein